MQEMNPFVYQDAWPSWFANSLQKYLSVGAFGFRVIASDATHIEVPAGAGDQAAVISIEGLWRWMEANVGPVAHPGGAAGVYPAFVTAKNNSIDANPQPYTDHTDYTFALTITAPGATPAIVAGTVDQYRHVADVHWDGAAITRIDQLVPATPLHAAQHATAGSDPLAPADIGAVPFTLGGSATRQAAAHIQGRIWHETDTNKNLLDAAAAWWPLGLAPVVVALGQNVAAVDGDDVLCKGGNIITLPAATVGKRIGLTFDGGVTSQAGHNVVVNVTGADQIEGKGLAYVGTFTQGAGGSNLVLACHEAGVWRVVAGEFDTGWIALTLAGGYTWPFTDATTQPALRKIGNQVFLRGIVQSAGQTAVALIPNAYSPSVTTGGSGLDYPVTIFNVETWAYVQAALRKPGDPNNTTLTTSPAIGAASYVSLGAVRWFL